MATTKYLTPSDFFGKRTIYDALLSVDSHVDGLESELSSLKTSNSLRPAD